MTFLRGLRIMIHRKERKSAPTFVAATAAAIIIDQLRLFRNELVGQTHGLPHARDRHIVIIVRLHLVAARSRELNLSLQHIELRACRIAKLFSSA